MSIYLVNGPAGCGKSHFLYDMLLKKAEKDDKTSYIFVVPEQFALSTEKELVEKSDGNGIMNIEVLSFTRLAYRIMEEAGDPGYPLLNDMGKSMIIRKVMQEEREKLRLYAGKEKSAGFLDEIKSVISEFSQYLIAPEVLEGFAARCEHENLLSIKLSDISTIYRAFNSKLEGAYTTAETMFELCYKHIGKSEFLNRAVLVLDGFTGFTPCQYSFIEQLMSKISDIYVCVTMDNSLLFSDASGEGAVLSEKSYCSLFSMSADMVKSLGRLGEKNGFKTKLIDFEHYNYLSKEITFIRDNIFRYPAKPYSGNTNTIITAHGNKKQEAYYVAARVSELLREGLRYDEIAVITGDLDGYAPYFDKAFRDFKISCYIDESKDISSNPLISFISNLLNTADSNLRADEVTEFIKSPLAGYDRRIVCEFENYLICYGYRGRSKYLKKWTAEKKLRKKVNIDEINEMRADIIDRIEQLPENDGSSTIHDIITSVYKLFVSYGIRERLADFAAAISENGQKNVDSYVKEYEKVYEAVLSLFQQMEDLMGSEPCTYKEFLDIFLTGVRKTKLGVLPPNKDTVIVGDVKRTRLKGIKILFFAGVNEGVVPKTEDNGGVLTSEEREILEKSGCKLAPGIKEKPLNEEFYIYLALSKPKDRLFISYILTDDSGSEIKPSYVINLISMVSGAIPAPYVKNNISDLIGFDKGLSYVLENFGKENPISNALIGLYNKQSCPEAALIKSITDDYYTRGSFIALSPETADKLYNHVLISSISRMETFSSCAYKHFLKYGLGLEKRPQNEPDNLDYGNLFHDALKRFGLFVKNSGNDWKGLEPEIYEAEALNCFEEAVKEYSEGLYQENATVSGLAERMKKVMLSTVRAVVSQIQAGNYEPYMFEYAFNVPGRYMNLSGKIDRVDICREDGVTWLKITDYKSSSLKLDYVKLYYGLQLQLMVYMNSMINDKRFKNALPAAAFYQEVSDPMTESEENVALKKLRELRPTGIMLGETERLYDFDRGFNGDTKGMLRTSYTSDAVRVKTTKDGLISGNSMSNRMVSSEELKILAKYAGDKLVNFSKEIMQGKIEIKPYSYHGETPCEYCNYKGVCGFDRKQKNYRYNKINIDEEEAVLSMFNRDSAEN